MVDFEYYAPTKVVFGRDAELRAGELAKSFGATKVLVHFGGGSAERSGLTERVCRSLAEAGLGFVKFGGVVPNPRLSKVREGIELCRRENVDFLLAVGGGSVIDSAKAIGYGLANEGDVWDFFCGKRKPAACAPVGAVLTISAAGSEMSNSCVITNEDLQLKKGATSDCSRCKFALLNPDLTLTLPAFQTACGCVDILMHTMERYFTDVERADVTKGIAESLMRSVLKNARILRQNPRDRDARAEIMWAGSLSHNDLTGCGLVRDWSNHKIEHELSAMFDVAHGAGLSAIWGSWAGYVLAEHVTKFERFAVKVMGIPAFAEPERTAAAGIEALEAFFEELGMPVRISGLGIDPDESQLHEMARKCTASGPVGNLRKLQTEDVLKILRAAK